MFSWYVYYPCCVVATEVSDVIVNVGIRLPPVKIQLTIIHVLLAEWNPPTTLRSAPTVILANYTIASRLVLGTSPTSIHVFHTVILPLLNHFSHHSSDVWKVFNRFFILNILWISKSIPHLHWTHCGDCLAPAHDPSMPIAWFMVFTFC